MTRCFIHIGMEKTGSTSIQQAIRLNAPLLKEVGIAFPQGGMSRLNHNFLASAYMPPGSDRLVRGLPARVRKGSENAFLDAYRRDVMAEIRQSKYVIISGEHLLRLRGDEIGMLKRDLDAVGADDVMIFGVLRSPASYYLSLVQQEVKGSAKFPLPADFFVDYADKVTGWQQHFPCMFTDFESQRAAKEGIVGRFVEEVSRFTGVDLSSFRRDIPFANDSLSPEEMQIVQDFRDRWYRHQDGRLNRQTTRLIKALRKARGKGWRKPVLRPEISAFIAERHREEAAAVSALTGIALDVSSAEVPQKVHPHHVNEILENFDRSLYEQLGLRVGSLRHTDIRTKLSYWARRFCR